MKRKLSRSLPASAEVCEERALLSASPVVSPAISAMPSTANVTSVRALQSQWVYNTSDVNSDSGCQGYNGKGQTIAVVEAMHDPTLLSDVAKFEQQDITGGDFNYPPLNSARGGTLKVVGENGTSTLPTTSNAGTAWQMEVALDVEYAHLMAPYANIVVVEANTSSFSDLMTSVKTAAKIPGVSVVSMSWGAPEFSGESQYDSYFAHPGVTFLASAGNSGHLQYPAVSPNVIDVGGTNLSTNPLAFYQGETLWAGTGTGRSAYEAGRGTPDVVASAGSVDIVSNGVTSVVSGTGLSSPIWAAVIAEANEWHAVHWPTEALQAITPDTVSDLPTSDFHPVDGGGMGSPIGNYVVTDLGDYDQSGPDKLVILNPTVVVPAGVPTTIRVAVENSDGQIVTSDSSQVTLWMMGGKILGQANAVNGIATFTVEFPTALPSGTFLEAYDGWLTIDRMHLNMPGQWPY